MRSPRISPRHDIGTIPYFMGEISDISNWRRLASISMSLLSTYQMLQVLAVTTSEVIEDPESRFSAVLVGAAKLPGTRINRNSYLRNALKRHCSEKEIRRAIEDIPAAAGISLAILDRVANESIKYEAAKASVLSAAAGIPGLLFMPATVTRRRRLRFLPGTGAVRRLRDRHG